MRSPLLATSLLLWACGSDPADQLPARDVGPADSGADGGLTDSGATDGGPSDLGPQDGGPPDIGASDGGSPDLGPQDGGSGTGACEGLPCRDRLLDDQAFFALAVASPEGACQYDLEVTFITSIDGTEPTYYLDPRAHAAPLDFLRRELPTRYGTMDVEAYFRDFEREDQRTHWVGRIRRVAGVAPYRYAIDLYGSGYWGAQDVVAELQALLTRLAPTFPMPLGYGPSQYGPIRQAAGFANPPFMVHLPITCPGEACPAGPGPCVVIPPGAELCGHHQENRAIDLEHQNRIRVQLSPGTYRLVADTNTQLIGGGAFGPDQTPITPGPAVARRLQSSSGESWWVEQSLSAGGRTIDLRLDLGSPTAPVIFREPFLENVFSYGSVDGGGTFTDSVYLQTCSGSGWTRYYAEANFGGGDRVRIEYRHQLPFAGSGPWLLTGADVILGGQPRRVEAGLDLLYAGVHHNWDNQFWILFDQPVRYQGTDIHGLWVDEPGTTCCPVDSIRTLSSERLPVHTLDGSDYLRAPKLF